MRHLNREIGLIGLTFVAIGGMVGSGWLFAPLEAARVAGGAAMLAWLIGAVGMLLLALTFAEISAMLPVAGGIATVPYLSHGTLVSMLMGWTAWIGYNTAAPIEVEAMLRYLDPVLPWLYGDGTGGGLTLAGHLAAIFLLGLFVVVNAFGVRFFARVNSTVTWVKVAVPIVVAVTLLADSFSTANFTAGGGFAPQGFDSVLAAVSSGGVVFAFLGFRHAIDLAGEVRNPRVTIPLALILAIAICFCLYALLQAAFIGALTPEQLANGWDRLSFTGKLGPMGAIAASVGILWLVSLINAGAVISPFGGALVAAGSNARLALALSYNGFLPATFQRLSAAGVPIAALLLNLVIGALFLLLMPFDELLALNTSAIVLSLVVGPVAVVALRRLAPDLPRSFRLPPGRLLAGAAFVIATFIVYWSGWHTIWRLAIAVAIGLAIVALRFRDLPPERRDLRPAAWLGIYFAGMMLLSAFGSFGGTGDISHGWESFFVVGGLAVACFMLAARTHLAPDRFTEVFRDVGHTVGADGNAEGSTAR